MLAGVPRQSDVFREEMFGPVAMLFPVKDAAEAIDLANDSPFGLGASVWTWTQPSRRCSPLKFGAGAVFVNSYW